MFQEVGVNCLVCLSGYIWDPVLWLPWTRIRCEEGQRDQEDFQATQSLLKMTWPLRGEDNARPNFNFDPLRKKESNFHNHCPAKWPGRAAGCAHAWIWLDSIPKKGLILLLSLSAYICVSVYQVCIMLPDIRFLPSNTVLHVVTMALLSVHLSNEKSLCQLLAFDLKREKQFRCPKGRIWIDVVDARDGEKTWNQVTISKGYLASRAPTFHFCSLPSSLLPCFSNSLPQTQQPQSSCFLPPKSTFKNYLILKRESDVGTQMQVPSLTNWWLWTITCLLQVSRGWMLFQAILAAKQPPTHTQFPSPLS